MLSHSACLVLGNPVIAACQAPLPMDFSGRNTEVDCYFLSGDLPDPGIETTSPAVQADSLPLAPPGKP